jgi:hypothetical protein
MVVAFTGKCLALMVVEKRRGWMLPWHQWPKMVDDWPLNIFGIRKARKKLWWVRLPAKISIRLWRKENGHCIKATLVIHATPHNNWLFWQCALLARVSSSGTSLSNVVNNYI